MTRKIMLLASFTLMVALVALALPVGAQKTLANTITITNVQQVPSGGECTGAETDCVKVTWTVSNQTLKIAGFNVKVNVTYTEGGSNTSEKPKTVSGGVRETTTGVFHQGSGGLKTYDVSVSAFGIVNETKSVISTGTKQGNF